jgi:hypothetical protein
MENFHFMPNQEEKILRQEIKKIEKMACSLQQRPEINTLNSNNNNNEDCSGTGEAGCRVYTNTPFSKSK